VTRPTTLKIEITTAEPYLAVRIGDDQRRYNICPMLVDRFYETSRRIPFNPGVWIQDPNILRRLQSQRLNTAVHASTEAGVIFHSDATDRVLARKCFDVSPFIGVIRIIDDDDPAKIIDFDIT